MYGLTVRRVTGSAWRSTRPSGFAIFSGPPRGSVQATDGTVGQVFLLVLYAGSSQHQNDQVKLGRMTDWREMGEDVYLAAGAHPLLVDGEEKALLELRSVDFGPPEAASGSA